jgi:ATP-dependent Clp protease adaptor protein ClpS
MEKEQSSSNDEVAVAKPPKSQQGKPARKHTPSQLPPFHVVLLNDNDHTVEYVIEMMKVLFAYPPEKGFKMAEEVDREGRVIVFTTHKEMAELKRDQIHSFGVDIRVATCKGSMSAFIEPAEG